jgi:hypothetical protein
MLRKRVWKPAVCIAAAVTLAWASAGAPCRALISPYLEAQNGTTTPCLVDLQEQGLCFNLEQQTLTATVRNFDGYLQDRGVASPVWQPSRLAELTVVEVSSGDRLEIILAQDGPFGTHGTCRVLPERSAHAVR